MNRKLIAVFYSPDKKWETGKSITQQNLSEHRNYYQQLLEQGKVIIGGATLEDNLGLIILNIHDKEEAEKIIANDPAIKNKIMTAESKTFYTVFKSTNKELLDLHNLANAAG